MKTILVFLCLLTLPSMLTASSAVSLAEVRDFEADARQMQDRGLPMLLVVSQTHCSYCVRLKDEQILPMLKSGDYGDKALFREILIDPTDLVVDFDGTLRDPNIITARYRAWVTPTVLLLDADGGLLAEPLHGYNTPEMYGGYLDEAIDAALDKVRKP